MSKELIRWQSMPTLQCLPKTKARCRFLGRQAFRISFRHFPPNSGSQSFSLIDQKGYL